jgi:hypothetical protein
MELMMLESLMETYRQEMQRQQRTSKHRHGQQRKPYPRLFSKIPFLAVGH